MSEPLDLKDLTWNSTVGGEAKWIIIDGKCFVPIDRESALLDLLERVVEFHPSSPITKDIRSNPLVAARLAARKEKGK